MIGRLVRWKRRTYDYNDGWTTRLNNNYIGRPLLPMSLTLEPQLDKYSSYAGDWEHRDAILYIRVPKEGSTVNNQIIKKLTFNDYWMAKNFVDVALLLASRCDAAQDCTDVFLHMLTIFSMNSNELMEQTRK